MDWLKNLNRKEILSFVVVLVLGIAFFFFYNSYKPEPVYEMIGEIVEVKNNLVKIEGLVGRKNKTVEFEITGDTALNSAVLTITSEQLKAGGTFTPDLKRGSGGISDLSVGRTVAIHSRENLVVVGKAVAVKVDYSSFNMPESFGF